MLRLAFNTDEYYDAETKQFIKSGGYTLDFEHSLVSLSTWESKWLIPFLSETPKTTEQSLDYIKCMLITENPPPNWIDDIKQEHADAISEYLNAKQTATFIAEKKDARPAQRQGVVTSEIIYYWMVSLRMEKAYELWNLNRLLMLIRVINEKNTPDQKLTKAQARARTQDLNRARRAQLNGGGSHG